MIKYWPNKQSIKLNNAIVDLFLDTENKLMFNLSNKTSHYLYIDILNNINKNRLFNLILEEFKRLILNLVELNLSKGSIKNLNNQIFYIFIEKICVNFSYTINQKYKHKYKLISIENNALIKNLLIYLILGSSYVDSNSFLFDQMYTPYKHVQILFENFIVYTSNIVIQNLVHELTILSEINTFLKSKQICNNSYISSRSIVLFLNNLKWQSFLQSYIYQPKCMYNERYQVWLISSNGIVTKYIYGSRVEEIKKLTKFKIFFLLWMETKDIIIPKIERVLTQIGKYLLYVSISLVSNTIILLMKVIIFYLNK